MKKTFSTSKVKDELLAEIDEIRVDYSKFVRERKNLIIKFVGQDKIRVSCGRGATYWKYNFDRQGEIIVSRCTTIMDWIEIISISIIDIIFAFLFLHNRISLNAILVLLFLIMCEILPIYYLYVIYPIKIIERFIHKNWE